VNICIFVLRFYGGSKLGIPGLINAYGMAAKSSIENAKVKKWGRLEKISFIYNYNLQNKMDSIFQKFNVNIIQSKFEESIQVELEIDIEKIEELKEELKEALNGTIRVIQNL
jgi:putative IMPACT (imprinted ancient) family translation regulator